jgi:hypothetical protein
MLHTQVAVVNLDGTHEQIYTAINTLLSDEATTI